MTRQRIIITSLVSILLMIFGSGVCRAAKKGEFKLTPPRVTMGFFYGGENLEVSGTASGGTDIIVTFTGKSTEEVLNRKVRVAGIWINRGKVHVSGVPSLFIGFSNKPPEKILSRELLDRYQLDENGFEKSMEISPQELSLPEIRSAFINMKTRQKVYASFNGSDIIKMEPATNGLSTYKINFRWPKKAPSGIYYVRAFHCKEGNIVGQNELEFKVVEVGFPAWMSNLAEDSAFIYGIFAVVVALMVGLGIDFIASRLGKGGVTAH